MTKIIHREGDIWTSEAHALSHSCNTHGVMGSGIAVQFRQKYPSMYQEYRKQCLDFKFSPGDVFLWQEGGKLIFNLFGQNRPGKDARLEWIRQSVDTALRTCDVLNIPVLAMPRIGSGVGGLDQDSVEKVLTEVASKHKCDIELWTWKA